MTGNPMSGFGKTLAGSLALHAAAIAAAAFLFASGAGKVFITPVYTVDLVSRGPAMNQAVSAPAAPEPPAPEPKPLAAPQEAPVKPVVQKSAPTTETVKVKAKAKPSVEEALKKIEEKVDRRKEEKLVASSIDSLRKKVEADRRARVDSVARLKEEIGSRASSDAARAPATGQAASGGAPKASLEAKYPAYYGMIRDRVQENWIYPEGLSDNGISVIVSIKIARTGKLIDVAVEKSSGDEPFDSSLLKAVKKAAPFPPLPVDMEGSFLETGLRFCPGCAQ